MKKFGMFGLTFGLALAVCLVLSGGVSAQDAQYIGNAKCKMCHNKADKKIWDSWKASKHAKALETLKTDAAKEVAAKAGVTGDPSAEPKCLVCHVTAYDEAKKAAPTGMVAADGVQCESCHGAASLHSDDAKKKMKGETVDMAAHIKKTPAEDGCKACHNEKSPTFKPFDYKERIEKAKHTAAK